MSSAEIYGIPRAEVVVEDHEPQPLSPYAVAKLAAEGVAGVLARVHGLEVVVVRPFAVYGPASPPWSLVGIAVGQALQDDGAPVVMNDLERVRDLTYVDDVGDLLVRAATTPIDDLAGRAVAINAATGQGTSVLELARAALAAAGREAEIAERPARPAPCRRRSSRGLGRSGLIPSASLAAAPVLESSSAGCLGRTSARAFARSSPLVGCRPDVGSGRGGADPAADRGPGISRTPHCSVMASSSPRGTGRRRRPVGVRRRPFHLSPSRHPGSACCSLAWPARTGASPGLVICATRSHGHRSGAKHSARCQTSGCHPQRGRASRSAAAGARGDNVLATAALARAVGDLAPEARFVNVSSGSVYGLSSISETPSADPEPYAVTKRAAELAIASECAASGLAAASGRVFNLIGPGLQDRHLPGRIALELALLEGLDNGELRVGSLEAERDLIDVRDAADALTAVASASRAAFDRLPAEGPLRVVDVGTGRLLRMRDLVRLQLETVGLAGKVEVIESEARPIGALALCADPAAIAELGASPQVSLERSVAEMADYARSQC